MGLEVRVPEVTSAADLVAVVADLVDTPIERDRLSKWGTRQPYRCRHGLQAGYTLQVDPLDVAI